MQFKRVSTIVATALLCLLVMAPAANAASLSTKDWPAHLRMLTGPNGGQWFSMGDPIAEVLSRHTVPTTSRIGGGLDNIGAINSKTGDLGFSLTCFMGAASSGEAEYKDIKLDNTVVLANIYPQVLYFLVRKDFAEENGITDVETLLQKNMPLRFASLKPGTASEFILKMLLKFGYNTSFEQLEKQGWNISFNNYAETADNFVDGELDCFAYTAGTTVPLIKIMEEHTDVLILPLEQKVLNILADKFKTGTYVIKPGDYKNVNKPITTLGDYTCILVRKDLPDSLVYSICEALWKGRKQITSVVKDFGGLSLNTALPVGLPTHPGAAAFWKQAKK